jgi:hypothetical protein
MKKIFIILVLGLYIGLKLKKSKEEKTKFVEDWIKNHEFEWDRIKEKINGKRKTRGRITKTYFDKGFRYDISKRE